MQGGRMSRGWQLTKRSWSVVQDQPGLMVLPAWSLLCTIAAAVALLGPWSLNVVSHHSRTDLLIAAAVCAYPFTLISTFFNVAFYAMADAAMSGRRMGLGEALRFARSRGGAVILWATLATLVGLVLRALEQIPTVGGLAGRIAEWALSVAWSLASFFVLPALAVEPVNVRGALRRSVATIRARWGESVTGDLVIGSLTGIALMPLILIGIAGAGLFQSGSPLAPIVLAVDAGALALLLVTQSAVMGVFRLAVFRWAADQQVVGPFSEAELASAFKPRGRRRFGR
jgi:hypothetical protein